MANKRDRFSLFFALLAALLGLSLAFLPERVFPSLFSEPERHEAAVSASPAPSSPGMGSALPELPSPERLARAFGEAPASATAPRAEAPSPTPAEPEITRADWLRPVGRVEDGEGIVRFFYKNTRTGALLGVRGDGSVEDGVRLVKTTADSWILEIEGGLFEAPGGDR